MLETEQMFREAGEKWPIIIPEEELLQPAPGFKVVEDGYEFFAKRRLVTIFSAPNSGGKFDNSGALLSVNEGLVCSFEILKPADRSIPSISNSKGPLKNPGKI